MNLYFLINKVRKRFDKTSYAPVEKTLCILMDLPFDIDTLSMGLSIVYLNGS